MTASEIAAALGVTRNAVIGIIKRARDKGQNVDRPYISKKYVKPSGRVAATKRKSEPKPQVNVQLRLVHEEPGDALTLQDLKSHHCRWVKEDKYFCGQPREGKSWWCHEHHQVVYRPRTEFNRKRAT